MALNMEARNNKMIIKSNFLLFGLLFIFLSISPLLPQQAKKSEQITLAVMDFKNNSSVFRFDRLERAIPEMLKTELSHHSEIFVVERSKIESILKEQALAQAGVIENETAQKVGQLAGAEYIITGEINTIGDQLRIDAHLIKVATGQVLGEKITGKNIESVEPMVKLLAQNLIYSLTGKGERQDFIKIKRYYSNWGLATTAAVSITSAILHFKFKSNYDKYQENDHLAKFDQYYNDANSYYKARNITLMIAGTAALTTFILWRKDVNEENKIYASSGFVPPSKQFAFAFAVHKGNYVISLELRF